jgi:hypothetical protein
MQPSYPVNDGTNFVISEGRSQVRGNMVVNPAIEQLIHTAQRGAEGVKKIELCQNFCEHVFPQHFFAGLCDLCDKIQRKRPHTNPTVVYVIALEFLFCLVARRP